MNKGRYSIAFYILLILTLSWFVFMTWLSHQNGAATAQTSGNLARELFRLFHRESAGSGAELAAVNELNSRLRHAAHTAVFLVLTVLVLLTLRAGGFGFRAMWIAVFVIAVWAWGDEATKPFIIGRHFAWSDVRLNWLGVGLGTALIVQFTGLFHSQQIAC